jgi:serine/threonine-protein kinase
VATAVAHAPHLADTHLADALIADYSGDTPYAVRALRRALGCDPMHAFSHEVLGRIELEGGLARGANRLLFAHDLDGAQVGGLAVVARDHFFAGRQDDGHALLRAIDAIRPGGNESLGLRVRTCQWARDRAGAQALLATFVADDVPVRQLFRALLGAVIDDEARDGVRHQFATLIGAATSPKRLSYLHQLCAESFAHAEPAVALQHIVTAAQLPLSDLRWLDACPALAPLRDERSFGAARRIVEHRLDLAFAGVATAETEAPTAAMGVLPVR